MANPRTERAGAGRDGPRGRRAEPWRICSQHKPERRPGILAPKGVWKEALEEGSEAAAEKGVGATRAGVASVGYGLHLFGEGCERVFGSSDGTGQGTAFGQTPRPGEFGALPHKSVQPRHARASSFGQGPWSHSLPPLPAMPLHGTSRRRGLRCIEKPRGPPLRRAGELMPWYARHARLVPPRSACVDLIMSA